MTKPLEKTCSTCEYNIHEDAAQILVGGQALDIGPYDLCNNAAQEEADEAEYICWEQRGKEGKCPYWAKRGTVDSEVVGE